MLVDGVQRDRRVGVGAGRRAISAATQIASISSWSLAPLPLRSTGVTADAVGTLRDVRDGYSDQLLGFLRQRAIGEHLAG